MKSKRKILMLAFTALLFFSCEEERFINEPGNLVPKTVDQDPNLPSIIVNGAKLHSEAYGHPDSTIIVCIHGGPGGDYRYMLNCKELVNYGYRVVFYDQIGSGLSQRFPKSSYTSLGIGALDLIYDELSGVIAHYRTNPIKKYSCWDTPGCHASYGLRWQIPKCNSRLDYTRARGIEMG